MPAPAVRKRSARSCTRTLHPRCASAHAAVRPAKPAPAIWAWRCFILRRQGSSVAQLPLVLGVAIGALPTMLGNIEDDAVWIFELTLEIAMTFVTKVEEEFATI